MAMWLYTVAAAQSLEGRSAGAEQGEAMAAAPTPRAKCSLELRCPGASQPTVMLCEVWGQRVTPHVIIGS